MSTGLRFLKQITKQDAYIKIRNLRGKSCKKQGIEQDYG